MDQKITKRILFYITISIILILSPYRLIVIKGDSMLPTYKNNQIVLAKKTDNYKKNDIVIFKSEDEFLIKRILYIGGDHIYFYLKNEKIYIDNSYDVVNSFKQENNNVHLYNSVVPEDHYFVVGDNLNHSDDSRRFGWISKEDIIYKVIN